MFAGPIKVNIKKERNLFLSAFAAGKRPFGLMRLSASYVSNSLQNYKNFCSEPNFQASLGT